MMITTGMVFFFSVMGLAIVVSLIGLLIAIHRERKLWNNGICAASGHPWTNKYVDARDENGYTDTFGNYADFQFNCVTNSWPDIFTTKIF
jgi:hypothetical protein